MIALAGFALAACAQQPAPRAHDPASLAAPPAGAPTADAPLAAPSGAALPPGEEPWREVGVTRAQYREDVESCYAYAQGQIAHDERIEVESGAAFEAYPSGLGVTELRGRMDRFERGNRRASLYSECMLAKGYRAN